MQYQFAFDDLCSVANAYERAQVPSTPDKRKRYKLPSGFTPITPLYYHQLVGVHRLICNAQYGLFDEPGLGKTLQLMYAVYELQQTRRIERTIIICKASHAYTWQTQLQTHLPSCTVHSLVGKTPVQRIYNDTADFTIVNYELLQRTGKHYSPPLRVPWSHQTLRYSEDVARLIAYATKYKCAVVCDESQYIKSMRANITRTLCALAPLFTRRYIATGTPISERPDDAWSQVFFLDSGKLFGTSYLSFLRNHADLIQTQYGLKVIRYKNMQSLHKRLRMISVRRLKDDCLDLPPKLVRDVPMLADATHERVMQRYRDALLTALHVYKGNTITPQKNSNISQALQDIQVAAAMPCLLDAQCERKHNTKYQRLLDDLHDMNGAYLIVWCVHVTVAKRLTQFLQQDGINVACIYGDVAHTERARIIEAFQSGTGVQVLVATQASLRENVTLTRAKRAVYYELDWALTNWVQSQDRIHRIDAQSASGTAQTTEHILLDVFLLRQSLDEYMFSVIQAKQLVAQSVTDGGRHKQALTKLKLIRALRW